MITGRTFQNRLLSSQDSSPLYKLTSLGAAELPVKTVTNDRSWEANKESETTTLSGESLELASFHRLPPRHSSKGLIKLNRAVGAVTPIFPHARMFVTLICCDSFNSTADLKWEVQSRAKSPCSFEPSNFHRRTPGAFPGTGDGSATHVRARRHLSPEFMPTPNHPLHDSTGKGRFSDSRSVVSSLQIFRAVGRDFFAEVNPRFVNGART